ncbi:MAG: DUF1343 domain-containing protein [Deltaproteobacteria bacterium]|nr:DUF1343 domain-containing protein [Deltaproteobacteria bacterium]
MRTGLERLLDNLDSLRGKRVGVAVNQTAVNRDLDHLLELLRAAGVAVRRVFTPEHGLHATAQDMIAVEGGVADNAIVSLYGKTVDTLRPSATLLADLDVVLFDIQDIGSRYYTYQATLGYMMEVAATTGTRIVVLDRPNPIDGVSVEGNVVEPGYESFVSAYPLAVRHGMTMGELAYYFRDVVGIACEIDVVPMDGWSREQWYDECGLPWVYPSPNMPTLDTATIYPGMCLVEGTNLSEGRGTTRPFHLLGAPWLDGNEFTRLCRLGAADAGLEGVAFRAASFEPRFQKFAGRPCHGTEIFVTDRLRLNALLLGLVTLEAAIRADPHQFRWRTETYEFVDEPIAIDLLLGSAEGRVALESRLSLRDLVDRWTATRPEWDKARANCLIY